jgi:hypothetical protein
MLMRSPAVRIYLATGATGLRRSIDGVVALIQQRDDAERAAADLDATASAGRTARSSPSHCSAASTPCARTSPAPCCRNHA